MHHKTLLLPVLAGTGVLLTTSVAVDAFQHTLAASSSVSFSPGLAYFSTKLYADKDDNSNNNDDDNDNDEAWDANVDYDAEWPQGKDGSSSSTTPDPSTAWDALHNMPSDLDAEKLGIDLNLEPLTQAQAEKLKKDASEAINDAIEAGIEDIERLRSRMNREIEASKRAMQLASDLEAQQQQEKLMEKIDKLTGNFLQSNEQERKKTQLAAAANRAMEGSGRGLEMGTWGVLDGKTVLADDGSTSAASSLLGSVDNAVQSLERNKDSDDKSEAREAAAAPASAENRILLIADTKQDSLAKQLVPVLLDRFESDETKRNIPNLNVEVLSPTSNMPIGGNNAACVVVFCTSVSSSSTLNNMLDRLLRKTLQSEGQVGTPPTQLVGISTLGTERFDKFPYSMQNLMGGKLESRRQVEEVLINAVKNRVTEPPLDYTLIKMNGDKFSGSNQPLDIAPGDVLDDPTTLESAAVSILQAVAYQPAARNATMSISGAVPMATTQDKDAEYDTWQDLFLCLDGPEVWRSEVLTTATSEDDPALVECYNELVEYMREWADLFASSGKGLTTPIRSEHGLFYTTKKVPQPRTILRQDGVQLLFLPTATGKNYVSRDEEIMLEKERSGSGGKTVAPAPPRKRKLAKEGGVDACVEIVRDIKTQKIQLRVRARRANYGDDAVIKELSEETILKRMQDALEVWKKDQKLA